MAGAYLALPPWQPPQTLTGIEVSLHFNQACPNENARRWRKPVASVNSVWGKDAFLFCRDRQCAVGLPQLVIVGRCLVLKGPVLVIHVRGLRLQARNTLPPHLGPLSSSPCKAKVAKASRLGVRCIVQGVGSRSMVKVNV